MKCKLRTNEGGAELDIELPRRGFEGLGWVAE